MKKLILTFAFVAVAQFGFAQEDAAFKADVMKVIERSGSGGQMNSAKKQILGMIPEDKHAAFTVEFDAMLPKIYEGTAKIYMEEYTKEDIKAMLAFYESPVGKKMAEKAEVIAEKSQASMMELQGEIQSLVMKYMQ
jgi:ethanolamine utilization microcompartment shell protein EutL